MSDFTPSEVSNPATYAAIQRVKEIIWAADNASPRTQQRTVGPSEIGTACDRKLAYKLAGYAQINHRKDHWAAIVGTSVHAWMAAAYARADNGSGRYLIEHRVQVTTPSGVIIPGTLDLFDRLTGEVWDWKCIGSESARHYKRDGSPLYYLVQGDIYGLGLEQQGEQPKRVGQIYLPRDGHLDDIFGYSDVYNRKRATDAIDRYLRIKANVDALQRERKLDMAQVPKEPSRLCDWCAYNMPDSPNPNVGCNGKKEE